MSAAASHLRRTIRFDVKMGEQSYIVNFRGYFSSCDRGRDWDNEVADKFSCDEMDLLVIDSLQLDPKWRAAWSARTPPPDRSPRGRLWACCVSSVPARKERHAGAGTIRDHKTPAVRPANGVPADREDSVLRVIYVPGHSEDRGPVTRENRSFSPSWLPLYS